MSNCFDPLFPAELAAAILAAFLIRRYLFFLSFVKGRSMMNTLLDRDILLVRPTRRQLPPRGSIVICHYPGRVLRWPPTVRKLVLSFSRRHPAAGARIRPFFRDFFHIRACFVKRLVAIPGDTVEIHDGVLFINGETAIPPASCATLYPPLLETAPVQLGEHDCFVLGDNRTNSNDSRFIGPIPDRMILGRVVRILFPLSRFTRL